MVLEIAWGYLGGKIKKIMGNLKSHRGVATPAIIAIVALILVLGGIGYFVTRKPSVQENQTSYPAIQGQEEEPSTETPTILAGMSALLIDYNKADYEAAIVSGEPKCPQYGPGTQYTAWKWADPKELIPAAQKGSLCTRLFLEKIGRMVH